MKKSKKLAIAAAVGMIFVGLCMSAGAMFAINFDFSRLNTVSFETKTYAVDRAFSDVVIDESGCDVRLYPSEDGECKVVCQECDNVSYSVTVDSGTLRIELRDDRGWNEYIGVYTGARELSVYLPESGCKTFSANIRSGNITVPEGFEFESASVGSGSGNIELSASATGEISAKTSSGNVQISDLSAAALTVRSGSGKVTIENANVKGEIKAQTRSGEIRLSDVRSGSVSAASKTGNIILTETAAEGSVDIENSSGNVELQRSDAGSLRIKTKSGGVSGSLLTDKVFLTDTSTGNVEVPKSASGGKCEISTGSGNIEFN